MLQRLVQPLHWRASEFAELRTVWVGLLRGLVGGKPC